MERMGESYSDQVDRAGDVPRGTRLTGWKEIAVYLDKAVRTVQRWERDFDLPIRRASEDRTSSVYAFTDDLDAWLRSPAGTRAGRQESLDDEAARPPAEATPPSVSPPGPRHRVPWITWILAGALLVTAAAFAWHTWRPASPPIPASWRVDGKVLSVFDVGGRVVFTHTFEEPLTASAYAEGTLYSDKLVGVDDLDGDGRYEFWIVAVPARTAPDHQPLVYLFNQDGTVRWQYRFQGAVTFGGQRFDPPWHPHFLFVTDRPEGGPGRAIWLASIERTSFPSVLQRLDIDTGRPVTNYWNNGYVTSVALGSLGGRRVLLVGAAFNDTGFASLAVLDPLNPHGSAPAVRDKYRCDDCPPGQPLAFVLFPKPPRFVPLGTNGAVVSINAGHADDIVVIVSHAMAAGDSASAIYRLNEDLRPTLVDAADGFLRVYGTLVRQGVLQPFGREGIDPVTEFPPLLYWKGGTTFEPARK